MVNYLKSHIVNSWIEGNLIREEDRELYEYGIEITTEYVLIILTTIFLAAVTGELISCSFMFLSFMTLRSYSGGVHAKNFIRCYIYSTMVIFVTLILIRFELIDIWIYRGIALFSLFYLWITKPVESENKEVSEPERVVFRRREKMILAFVTFISVIAILTGFVKIEKGLESTLIIAGISSSICYLKQIFNFEVRRGVDTNMIRIAVCDDEEIFLNEIERIITKMQDRIEQRIHIETFTTAKSLEFAMDKRESLDILFMDIELGKDNGIEVTEKIKKQYPGLIVIYITSHYECVYDVFKTEPLDFIRKPIDKERLEQCVLRALDKCYNLDYLKVRYQGGILHIKIKDIMYIYSDKKKLHICVADNDYTITTKLDNIAEVLKEYDEFIRIQKSYLVNFNYVKRYEPQKIILRDDKIFSVSRDKKEEVRKKYVKLKM